MFSLSYVGGWVFGKMQGEGIYTFSKSGHQYIGINFL